MAEAEVRQSKSQAFRQIWLVFGALALLTAGEFLVATSFNSAVLLLLIALAKAALIVNFFMHIYRLWSSEEGH